MHLCLSRGCLMTRLKQRPPFLAASVAMGPSARRGLLSSEAGLCGREGTTQSVQLPIHKTATAAVFTEQLPGDGPAVKQRDQGPGKEHPRLSESSARVFMSTEIHPLTQAPMRRPRPAMSAGTFSLRRREGATR